jgi:DNA-binding transcriptional LysR family regulator
MNLSTRQLKAFVAVARLRSFTRAAEEIHISQAGLSLMLRDMETQLDCRLFERTTRAVWLTDGGARLLPVAERMVRELDEVAGELGKLSADAARTLTVAATPLVCASVLPEVCRTMARLHPGVKVVVRDTERGQVESLVASGEVDVGLGVLFTQSAGIHRKPLLKVPLVCVSPRRGEGFPLAPGRRPGTLTWSALKGVPLIALPADNTIQQMVDARLAAIGRGNEPRQTYRSLHTLVAMVDAGYGAAVLPSFVREACGRYEVDVNVLVSPRSLLDFYAVTRKGVLPSPGLAPFLECFVSQMSRYGLPVMRNT